MDLREHLINASLAVGNITYTNAEIADRTMPAVAAWLREADTARAMAEETTEHHWYRDDDDSCSCGQWRDGDGSIHAHHVAQVGLAFLADAIDPQPERSIR